MAMLILAPPRLKRLGRTARRRGSGLLFLAVLAGLIWLSVAQYGHDFTPAATVTLQVSNVGDQLTPPADVKLRGLIVGTVTAVHASATGATMTLRMKPEDLAFLPANVLARILPKTLFGEKFVDLVLPPQPSAQRLAAGMTITEDRSRAALEAETVFDHLLPLLRTLHPAQLNETLTAIATALQGQSAQLGQNLVLADNYFTRFNPHLPVLNADISGVADLATNYAAATPNLLAMLRNFSVNANTLVDKRTDFAQLLSTTLSFATTASTVLQQNSADLIQLASVSRPTLSLLQAYSPEFSCLLTGLTELEPRLNKTFSPGPELHILLQDVPSRGAYSPADAIQYGNTNGPNCYGLPLNPQNNVFPGPPSANEPAGSPGSSTTLVQGDVGTVGSLREQQQIAGIVQSGQGPQAAVGPLDDALLGPMLRGTAVSVP